MRRHLQRTRRSCARAAALVVGNVLSRSSSRMPWLPLMMTRLRRADDDTSAEAVLARVSAERLRLRPLSTTTAR